MFTLAPNYFTSEDPDKKVSKVHKCSICGHRFRLSIHLNSHVTNFHEALKNRKCNDCGRVYADLNDLKLHRIERHGAKLKKPKKLLNQSLNNSFKAFSPGRIFTPPMARRTFSIFRTPTPNRRFTTIKNFTPGSSKRNSSVKTLFKTSKTPKVGNRYLCIACGRTLISKPGLKRHIKNIHDGIKRGEDVAVIQQPILKTPKRKFKCTSCDKSYMTQSHLKRHRGLMHNDDTTDNTNGTTKIGSNIKEKISCIFCKLTFSWREAFLNHIKHAHAQRKYFQCEFCDELFGEKEIFVDHLQSVHDADQVCNHCDKAFFHPIGLQNHMRKEHNEESVISL